MRKTVSVFGKDVDVYKQVIRVLFGLVVWFALHEYNALSDRFDRMERSIRVMRAAMRTAGIKLDRTADAGEKPEGGR